MDLPEGKYRTVVIDPPWDSGGYWFGDLGSFARTGKGTKGAKYKHKDFDFPTMKDEEIQAIDLDSILEEDSFVFLWAVMNRLSKAFDILKNWGVRPVFTMTWMKPNGPRPSGFPAYNSEFCLVGKKGKPRFLTTKGFFTANQWDQRRISGKPSQGAWGRQVRACEKPEMFYDLLRKVTPPPRLDMFSRRSIEGFQVWGLEASEEESRGDPGCSPKQLS